MDGSSFDRLVKGLAERRGGTVSFTVFGVAPLPTALPFEIREIIFASVPFMAILGTV